MKFAKQMMDLADAKELEVAKANVAKQDATIRYVAMMCDVDLPEEEERKEENEVAENE